MGLPKIIQITSHNVLDDQNALKFKKGAPLKQFFNINLGIGIIKKTTFFVHIFDIYPCVFTQILIERAHWMHNLILHPRSTHIAYFWWTSLLLKQEIPEKMWWWHHHHVFSGISYFWGSEVHQKYVVWVFVGCGIEFYIQIVLPIKIWVKPQRNMLKIRRKK